MTTKTATAIIPASEPAEMSVPALMNAIVSQGVTEQTVGVMKELVALKRDMDKDASRIAFNRAFVALQRDLKPVQATRNLAGRSLYANFDDLMDEIQPLLEKHGFCISFGRGEEKVGFLTATCSLIHQDGWERSNDFTVPSEQARGGNSAAQTTGGSFSFAKRYAMCALLNIVVTLKDQDARMLGEPITEDEAADLERRVAATGRDSKKFLAIAGADSFASIRRAGYRVAINALELAERAVASKGKGPTQTKPGEFDNLPGL